MISDSHQKLRAAVIGLGVGMRHAEAIVEHPRAAFVACCDIDPAKRKEAAARFPGVPITADARAILRDPQIDVVVIASYDNEHADQVVEAMVNGKHVFVEKPLCLTLDEAQRIVGLLREHPDLRLSSNLILRKSPRFMLVRDMVARGDFGDLFAIEGGYHFGRIEKITEGWRGRIPFYSVVYGGGVHIVDLLRWISGDEVIRVTAYGNRIATRGSQFQYRDTIVSILEFRSGIIGKVAVYFGSVDPHFHPFTVLGTKATFVNDRGDAALYTSRDPMAAPQRITEPYPGVAKGVLLSGFIDAILDDSALDVPVEEVFRTMAVCFAIEAAADRGVPVDVAEFLAPLLGSLAARYDSGLVPV